LYARVGVELLSHLRLFTAYCLSLLH